MATPALRILATVFGCACVAALRPQTAKDQQQQTKPLLAQSSALRADRTCVANTGGSCRIKECFDWRGNTTCSSGHCLCRDGFCAGADGKCHDETNELAASGFRLRNVRWADYFLHFPSHGVGMKVHNIDGRADASDLFDLYALPGSNRTQFLLGSTAHPNRVSAAQTGDSEVAITKTIANRGVDKLGVKLVRAPAYEGSPFGSAAVMIAPIQNHLKHSYYTVIPSLWTVPVKPEDHGTGAYWLVEPASALEDLLLPEFEGQACRRDCGFYNSGTSTQGKASTTALYGIIGLSVFGPIVLGLGIYLVMRWQQVQH